MTTKTDTAQEAAIEAVGLPKVSDAELDKAKREGVLEAAREAAKDTYKYATDGNLPSTSDVKVYPGSDDIMMFEPLLSLDGKAFTDAIADLADNKAAGLLKLERAGQNRTDKVKALCARLGVKSPYEVTDAGPNYTNDTTNVSPL